LTSIVFDLALEEMVLLKFLVTHGRNVMARNRWERPVTHKGNKRRASQKQRSAKVKQRKASFGFITELLFGGRKKK
jgi:hypothetical protein